MSVESVRDKALLEVFGKSVARNIRGVINYVVTLVEIREGILIHRHRLVTLLALGGRGCVGISVPRKGSLLNTVTDSDAGAIRIFAVVGVNYGVTDGIKSAAHNAPREDHLDGCAAAEAVVVRCPNGCLSTFGTGRLDGVIVVSETHPVSADM